MSGQKYFIVVFTSLGKSSDDEKEKEPISLGDCPVPHPKMTSAVPGMRLCWWMMSFIIVWQLVLAN